MPRWKPHYVDFPADDRIARLFIHYFGPCEQLFEDYQRSQNAKTTKGERTIEMRRRTLCYLLLWLASLFAVLEGFRALKLSHSKIDKLSTVHWDSLRHLRNGTFHFQPRSEKQIQFFVENGIRVEWAKQVYFALKDYFSDYKVEQAVQQFMRQDPADASRAPAGSRT